MGAGLTVLDNGNIVNSETNQLVTIDQINQKLSAIAEKEKNKLIKDFYEIYKRPGIYDALKKQLGYK